MSYTIILDRDKELTHYSTAGAIVVEGESDPLTIQNAIDRAADRKQPLRILNCTFRGNILVHDIDSFEMAGCDITNLERKNFAVELKRTRYFSIHNCTVHDTEIDGIHCRWSEKGVIEDVFLYGTNDDAIAVTTDCSDIEIARCTVNKSHTRAGCCVRVANSKRVDIHHCTFTGKPAGLARPAAVRVGYIDGTEPAYDVTVHHCHLADVWRPFDIGRGSTCARHDNTVV